MCFVYVACGSEREIKQTVRWNPLKKVLIIVGKYFFLFSTNGFRIDIPYILKSYCPKSGIVCHYPIKAEDENIVDAFYFKKKIVMSI